MMLARFAPSDVDRQRGSAIPELALINGYVEPQDDEWGGGVIGIPGATAEGVIPGAGSIRLMMARDRVFDGDMMIVRGRELSRRTAAGAYTLITGALLGDDVRVRAAVNDNNQMLLTDGGERGYTDDSTYSASMGSLPTTGVADVGYLNGRGLALLTSGRVHWSGIDNFASWAALDYATAEYRADGGVALSVERDGVFVFGTETIEGWAATGDPDLPIAPRPGAVWEAGCAARDSVIRAGDQTYFVSSEKTGAYVMRLGGGALQKVSTPTVDRAIQQCLANSGANQIAAWSYSQNGHLFVGFDLACGGTHVYDVSSGLWHRRAEYRGVQWGWTCVETVGGVIYVGSRSGGKFAELSEAAFDDAGSALITTASAWAPIRSGLIAVDRIELDAEVGGSPSYSLDPKAMLRLSRDRGQSWSDERVRSLGARGEYGHHPVWRSMGRAGAPGLLLELRISDAARRTLRGFRINETPTT